VQGLRQRPLPQGTWGHQLTACRPQNQWGSPLRPQKSSRSCPEDKFPGFDFVYVQSPLPSGPMAFSSHQRCHNSSEQLFSPYIEAHRWLSLSHYPGLTEP